MSFATPMGRFLLCKRIEEEKEQVTKSGLVLANVTNNNLPRAEVLAVGTGFMGPDGKWNELPFKPGQTIMYGFNTDIAFEHNDETYVMINCDMVLAIINE